MSTDPRSRVVAVVLAAFVVLAGCRTGEPEPRGEEPSLLLFLVVDPARYDYLERYASLFDGGLARVLESGISFSDAHHDHSMTATAPGHASLSTGTEPARSGIIGNGWYDRESGEVIRAVSDSQRPSPELLEVTALGDWLKEADPRSKVFTASAKPRAAVMLGGQNPDGAYWYDSWTGEWATSSYYADGEREWLLEINRRKLLDELFGTLWTPVPVEIDREEFGIRELDGGLSVRGFPHALGGFALEPDEEFYGSIYDSPFVDRYLGQLASTIITAEGLGQDGSIDLLGLSFSALDTVGHDYGPNSPEVLDVLLRLDRVLAELFDQLDREVGREHVIVAFSADHGIPPLPEMRELEGRTGGRLGASHVRCVQRAGLELADRIGGSGWLLSSAGGYTFDRERLQELGADPARVEAMAADLIGQCPAVERVWTSAELASDDPVEHPAWQRFENNFYPGRSPDLQVQLRPFFMTYQTGTTHGSVYDYDSQVPMIVAVPGLQRGRIDVRASTVDLAPTLMGLIGLTPPEGLDGVDRSEAVRQVGSGSGGGWDGGGETRAGTGETSGASR